jgi:hypothetical protein
MTQRHRGERAACAQRIAQSTRGGDVQQRKRIHDVRCNPVAEYVQLRQRAAANQAHQSGRRFGR